jgi:hypothetical protein
MARPLSAGSRAVARRVRRAAGAAPPGPGLPARRGALRPLDVVLGLVTSLLRSILDVVDPTPRRSASRRPEPVDPVTQQERRDAAVKASAELVEICIRVAATGPDRRRCRELAWQVANSLRLVVTAQGTDTIRLRRADRIVSTRGTRNQSMVGVFGTRAGHRRGWFVATDTEVGAIARLPHRPASYRFSVAGAPHLAAPRDIPRLTRTGVGPEAPGREAA